MSARHGRLSQDRNRCCWSVSDITLMLSYKLPTFVSDHLGELTGSARKNPFTNTALFPAFCLTDKSCPLSTQGNWTSLFHGENSACLHGSKRVWRDRCVCVCVYPCLSAWCDCDVFLWESQWQTTDQRSTGTVTNACTEWLTALNVSLLLVSLVINLICLITKA